MKIPHIVVTVAGGGGGGGASVFVPAPPAVVEDEVFPDVSVDSGSDSSDDSTLLEESVVVGAPPTALDSDSERSPPSTSTSPTSPLNRKQQSLLDRSERKRLHDLSFEEMVAEAEKYNRNLRSTLPAAAKAKPSTDLPSAVPEVPVLPAPAAAEAAEVATPTPSTAKLTVSPYVAAVAMNPSDALDAKPYVGALTARGAASTPSFLDGTPAVTVDPVAKPIHSVILFDKLSGNCMSASFDDGSCVSLIRQDEVTLLDLEMVPVADCPGMPAELFLANGELFQQIIGVVWVALLMEKHYLYIPLAVVDKLFCPVLLGRNTRDTLDAITGRQSVWTTAGDAVPLEKLPSATVAALTGATVSLVSNIWTTAAERAGVLRKPRGPEPAEPFIGPLPKPGKAKISRVQVLEQFAMVQILVPEQLLKDANGVPLEEIQGYFDSSGSHHASGKGIVAGIVDWKEPVAGASLRPVRFKVRVLAPLTRGMRNVVPVISAKARMGVFYVGRPVVATAAAIVTHDPETNPALKEALARLQKSEILMSMAATHQVQAGSIVRKFNHCEELPEAARLLYPPFKIRTQPGTRPTVQRNYPMSQEHLAFAEKQIDAWLRNGTIEPSNSEWASSIVIAHHPRTNKPRFCIDYRALNAATIGDSYLMPLITDIVESARGCTVFSKLDLTQGFGQYMIDEDSRHYTTFYHPRGGQSQFVGAPFGIKNVPAAFQRCMDQILGSMTWRCAAIYIDDCIVFSKSVEEHHIHLNELAERFAKFNVYIRSSKCLFYCKEVEFLGYIFNGATIRVIPERVESVLRMGIPANAAELRRFSGLCVQFCSSVDMYAAMSKPIDAIKQVNSKLPFDMSPGSPALEAFYALKAALLRMPELSIPDMSKPFLGYSDASDIGCSFVLCQVQDGVERVLSFYSKAFDKDQLKWSIPVKEAYSLHHWITGKGYRYFAAGGPHKVKVDSLAARALTRPSLKDPKLRRWAVDLAVFPLDVELIDSKLNMADPGTRPPFIVPDPHLAHLSNIDNPLRSSAFWQQKLASLDRDDPDLESQAVVAPILVPVLPHLKFPVSEAEFSEAQKGCEQLSAMAQFIAAGRPTPTPPTEHGFRAAAIAMRKTRNVILTETGLLVRVQSRRGQVRTQRVIPVSLRSAFLEEAHTGEQRRGLHEGSDSLSMLEALLVNVWWPGIREGVASYECAVCNRQKKDHSAKAGLLHSIVAQRPGQTLAMDLLPLVGAKGWNGAAVIVDKFSGFVQLIPYTPKKPKSSDAVQYVDSFRALFPDVQQLYVDKDSVLTSEEFASAMLRRGIEVVSGLAGRQQSDFAERSIQMIKQIIRTTLDGLPVTMWSVVVRDMPGHLNSVYLRTRGATAFEILTGWAPRSFLPYGQSSDSAIQGHVFASRSELWARVSKAHDIAAESQAAFYNAGRRDVRYVVGDMVLLKRKVEASEDGNFNLSPPYDAMPWLVTAVPSEVLVLLQSTENREISTEAHVADIRYAVLDEQDPRLVDPVSADASGEYIVQKIHAHRDSPAVGKRSYLVQWAGFRDKRWYTWEPKAGLEANAGDILRRYEHGLDGN